MQGTLYSLNPQALAIVTSHRCINVLIKYFNLR
jgi:hypothetical protein